MHRVPFGLADDRRVEYDVGQAVIRLGGLEMVSSVVFGEPNAAPLLGAITLELFNLGVEPVGQRLMPVPGLLMHAASAPATSTAHQCAR